MPEDRNVWFQENSQKTFNTHGLLYLKFFAELFSKKRPLA
jgi:hypothetical protein